MKKIFLWGLMATLALGSCTEDSGVASGNGETDGTEGTAYLTVRITNAGAGTKAAGNEGKPFENGSETEHKVSDARFFFYDTAGDFVTEATVWDGGTAVEGNGNIEFDGNSVIVLRGLTSNNYPNYLVTALNVPAGFTPANTLTEMEKALSGGEAGIYKSTSPKNFIMSTTSYARATDSTKPYYVTELQPNNFSLEPVVANPAKVVDIYVERLAAKVTLGISEALKKKAEDNGRYKLSVTVAGGDNDAESGNTETPAVAAEDIYVELLGWALNATAKSSYLVKNIDPAWTDQGLGFAWNDATNYRSYWGKSCNYGIESYPTEGGDVVNNPYLNYISSDEIKNAVGTASAYCAENTNNAAIAAKAAARTSILLKAKICDANGAGLDMVRYNGVLFKNDSYIDYLLNATQDDWNAWYCSAGTPGEAGATYTRMDKTCVELVDNGNGEVLVQLKKKNTGESQAVETAVTLYKRSGEEGSYTYTVFTETDITELDASLAAFNETNVAIGYKGGLMYYNIPIEHLNPIEANQGSVDEANYGVVRNHYYKVTVNTLENVGKGIYDPDEVIVPGDEDDERYYLGASIQILSWKIVEQGVDL